MSTFYGLVVRGLFVLTNNIKCTDTQNRSNIGETFMTYMTMKGKKFVKLKLFSQYFNEIDVAPKKTLYFCTSNLSLILHHQKGFRGWYLKLLC